MGSLFPWPRYEAKTDGNVFEWILAESKVRRALKNHHKELQIRKNIEKDRLEKEAK